MRLDELIAAIEDLPKEQLDELQRIAGAQTKQLVWVPNPGPQDIAAYNCLADELFYGGQAGGGKTDLLAGIGFTMHERSLLLRRTNKEARGLIDRIADIFGSKEHWNGHDECWRFQGRTVDIGGVQLEDDKQKYKGKPHDLIGFDEISDFSETQYRFIIGWNRTTNPKQRCRVVACGNPPTRAEGLWVIKYWAAWLDPSHPNPAKPGELRWYTTINGEDTEVDGPGPHFVPGEDKPVYARSRTFIPAELADNPDQDTPQYRAALAALPEELRAAYRDGNFQASLKDKPRQVIPTAWILEAQKRWLASPPPGVPMCSIGVDIAQGGKDKTILAARWDGYYAKLQRFPGAETPDGRTVAGLVIQARRDNATIVIDMGGGYGGAAYEQLTHNGIHCIPYKGSEGTTLRCCKNTMGLANTRAAAYWMFREALDPNQPNGSPIMLPPDDTDLIADLTAPVFWDQGGKIYITTKEDVVEMLGRSPDAGDAVVMSWWSGPRAVTHMAEWGLDARGYEKPPKVIIGRAAARYGR